MKEYIKFEILLHKFSIEEFLLTICSLKIVKNLLIARASGFRDLRMLARAVPNWRCPELEFVVFKISKIFSDWAPQVVTAWPDQRDT